MFKHRTDAARKLARRLQAYRDKETIVVGIPRGGVVIASVIADTLHCPMDIIVTRKISHPSNEEYAVGAVDAQGRTLMNEKEIQHIDASWLRRTVLKEQKEAARRERLYRQGRITSTYAHKIVILVDDGIATGYTMLLAVACVKAMHPDKLIVAVPVAPEEIVQKLYDAGADRVVVIEPPHEYVGAVGSYYDTFDQVSDEEVVALSTQIGEL